MRTRMVLMIGAVAAIANSAVAQTNPAEAPTVYGPRATPTDFTAVRKKFDQDAEKRDAADRVRDARVGKAMGTICSGCQSAVKPALKKQRPKDR